MNSLFIPFPLPSSSSRFDSGTGTEAKRSRRHKGHVARDAEEEEEEEEEEMWMSRQEEQKEWRQERILTGRVKTSRHTGHVREDLRSSISFLRSEEREGSEEEEDMEGTREGQGGGRREEKGR